MVTESWLQNHGYRIMVTESWLQNHGYRIMVTESWLQNHGYRIMVTVCYLAGAWEGAHSLLQGRIDPMHVLVIVECVEEIRHVLACGGVQLREILGQVPDLRGDDVPPGGFKGL